MELLDFFMKGIPRTAHFNISFPLWFALLLGPVKPLFFLLSSYFPKWNCDWANLRAVAGSDGVPGNEQLE